MGRERKLLRARFASAFHSARFPEPRLVAPAPPRPPRSRLPSTAKLGRISRGSGTLPTLPVASALGTRPLALFSSGVHTFDPVLVTPLFPTRFKAGHDELLQKRSMLLSTGWGHPPHAYRARLPDPGEYPGREDWGAEGDANLDNSGPWKRWKVIVVRPGEPIGVNVPPLCFSHSAAVEAESGDWSQNTWELLGQEGSSWRKVCSGF